MENVKWRTRNLDLEKIKLVDSLRQNIGLEPLIDYNRKLIVIQKDHRFIFGVTGGNAIYAVTRKDIYDKYIQNSSEVN